MCGIAGVAGPDPNPSARVEEAGSTQVHRGPDSHGLYAGDGVALGIQRLRVIDLETGDQPIYNEDRSVVVVLNGEVYNYRELREDLRRRGHSFSTRTDTEVIVHLYEEMGPALVDRLAGMFAFALWDTGRRRLLLARDRVGKKPVVYHEADGTLSFASELRALMSDRRIPRELDPGALDQYLAYGYVAAPDTIWKGVRKLPPGHRLIWEDGRSRVERWWRLDYSRHLTEPAEELGEELRRRVAGAVARRMIADVPLGAFLSGGIDSSVVVSEMAARSSLPVKTFSIGFEQERFNELLRARLIAERFGTDHTEFVVRSDAIELLPKLARHYGEPYADSSAIPTFHLAELTRRDVTVSLNGDGGDESFAGYSRHLADSRTAWLDSIPAGLRRALSVGGSAVLRPGSRLGAAGYAARFLEGLEDPGPDRYARHVGIFGPEERSLLLSPDVAAEIDPARTADVIAAPWREASGDDSLDRILQVDVETYLPGDLLTKVDIATMAHSLEARSPLLDHDVMEFAARLPPNMKIRGRQKKWLLRQAYRDGIPPEILDGPKRGFGVPLADWFRGDLRRRVAEILAEGDLAGGLVDSNQAARLLDQHVAGRADHSPKIWALLCLDAWHREYAIS